MRGPVIYACFLLGLFYFSEGKPCPEKSRPHKTRCDSYYKCRELPSNSHVWQPIKCREGLVYEHNVGSCVLPGDDWECLTASELATTTHKPNERQNDGDILIVNNDNDDDLLLKESSSNGHKTNDADVELVLDDTLSSEEQEDYAMDHQKPEMRIELEDNDSPQSAINNFDSSGDGELVELDGFLQADKPKVEISNHSKSGVDLDIPITELESKVHDLKAELKQQPDKPPTPIDPNLTAHLQRLSQLIDGLKQTYQQTDKPQMDLRPDQLNAFLAHFDIKNHFDNLNPKDTYKLATIATTTAAPVTVATTSPLPVPHKNKTLLQEHLSHNRLQPETKVVLMNSLPNNLQQLQSPTGQGYGNSQIVVNRPEGSVLFTLPHYDVAQPPTASSQEQAVATHTPSPYSHEHNEPKISEETLKTVLELSKQMIAAQHMPNTMQNPGYNPAYFAPQILQPLILSPQNNPFQQYYAPPMQQQSYEKPTHYVRRKTHHSSSGSSNRPSTTIIHNNVIPVHVANTNSGEKEVLDSYGNSLGKYPHIPELDKHSSNNHLDNDGNNNNNNQNYYSSNKFVATVTTARPAVTVTTVSTQYAAQYAPPYNSDFSMTTPRPYQQQQQQQQQPDTLASYYTPSPHLNEHNVNRVFQTESYPTVNVGSMPRPMHLAGAYPSGSSGSAASSSSYDMGQNMFPPQLDSSQVKIRPNSQKIESMEVEADEMINANYVNNNNNQQNFNYNNQQSSNYNNNNQPNSNYNNNNNNQQSFSYNNNNQQSSNYNNNNQQSSNYNNNNQQSSNYNNNQPSSNYNNNNNQQRPNNYNNNQHVLTYSSNSEPELSHQLAPNSYVEHNYPGNAAKYPYMPRPASVSTSIYDNSGGNLDVSIFNNGQVYGGTNPLKPKYPASLKGNHNHQLVNFDGSFISLDMFQKSILPLLTRTTGTLSELSKVEVINCQAGVRQPNETDCTRYFVCSKKDGKVMSYSCPPYTGFNKQTRICDAQTFAQCGTMPLTSGYSVDDNKRVQLEAVKLLSEAKRRQEAALKAQSIASLLQQYGNDEGGSSQETSPISSNIDNDMLQAYMPNVPVLLSSTTMRPMSIISPVSHSSSISSLTSGSGLGSSLGSPLSSSSSGSSSVKKRKYYCREGDKIPDQTSISSYFVCYKNAQGQMKGHKMSCTKGLLFCPKTLMCTLAAKCS